MVSFARCDGVSSVVATKQQSLGFDVSQLTVGMLCAGSRSI